jgi:hypothetical protein
LITLETVELETPASFATWVIDMICPSLFGFVAQAMLASQYLHGRTVRQKKALYAPSADLSDDSDSIEWAAWKGGSQKSEFSGYDDLKAPLLIVDAIAVPIVVRIGSCDVLAERTKQAAPSTCGSQRSSRRDHYEPDQHKCQFADRAACFGQEQQFLEPEP